MLELSLFLLIAATVTTRPFFKFLQLIVVNFGCPSKNLIIDMEHNMHLFAYFDLHGLGTKLAILLRKLDALGLR